MLHAESQLCTGDKYILARKLVKGATDLMYCTSEREYYLNSEDVRVINMKHKEVAVRRTARRVSSLSSKTTYEFDESEMEELKLGCWNPHTQLGNL